MRAALLIARKELASFFDSPMAYLVIVAFLAVSGFFTWWFGTDVFIRGLADLSTFFNVANWSLFILIPALTMRTVAEERKSGTLDLLLTRSITPQQVVAGKFLACLALIIFTLLCTLPYYATVAILGPIDHGGVACGYLGLVLMSAGYIALGIFTSSLTANQITAFILALVTMALFHFGMSVLAANLTGLPGQVFRYLGTGTHFESMGRGVVDSRDLVFFLSLTAAGLLLASHELARRGARRMSRRATPLIALLLMLAALLLVNLLAQRYKFRLDLTGDKRYTLDQATLDLLHGLPETVTVTAYFTGDLPPGLAVVRQDFKDLLMEYAERSGGKLVFAFEDPGTSGAIKADAVRFGIRPLLAQTRAKDRSENIQLLMGAVVRMGTQRAVIPALQKGSGMEWTLSSAIAQVTAVEKQLIGVMQGHREPSLHALDELAVQLNAQYDVEATAIYDSFPINERFASILIIDPRDSIPPQHQRHLDEYMAKGHGVVLALSAVATDLTVSPDAGMRDIGMAPWLAGHGVRIGPGVVVDEHCGQVGVTQSGIPTPVALPFPFYPLIDNFSEHPVAHGLDLVMFQFASPVFPVGDTAKASYAPVLSTGPKSGVLPAPLRIDLRKTWSDADFPLGPQVLGAAVEQKDGSRSRLVVFSNGNFCTGDQGGQPVQLPQGNLDLMVNATDWVTHNTRLLSVRGKEKDYRPISDPGKAGRTTLKWLNLLLPIAVVLLYGLFRGQWRRRQRKRRMRPGHVR